MLGKLAKATVEFLRKEDGPTAVEYAVMLALIVVVCFVAITTIGTNTSSNIDNGILKTALKGGS